MTPEIQAALIQEATPATVHKENSHLSAHDLSLTIAGNPILREISFTLPGQGITTLIGPSGAGKSTLLRCLNRLQDHWSGQLTIAGKDIRAWPGGEDALRRHIGLIAQKPCPFPCSIRENVTFGLANRKARRNSPEWTEQCLRQAALWSEVSDRLHAPAGDLSLGQQQRLCIARALAVQPAILMLDEPTTSLDPQSKALIEHTLKALATDLPLLLVTHDIDQARRLEGQVIFMCEGRIIEQGDSARFFSQPEKIESREFIRWHSCDCR